MISSVPTLTLTQNYTFFIMASSNFSVRSDRFVSLSANELDNISAMRHEESTKTATKFGSKVFREWLEARGYPQDFEVMEKNDLAQMTIMLVQGSHSKTTHNA